MPYCRQCGTRYEEGQKFCGLCGVNVGKGITEREAEPEKQPKKSKKLSHQLLGFLSGFLAAAILFGVFSLALRNDGKLEKGYSSPENAVTAYLEGLRDGDMDKMLSSFAAESFVEGSHLREHEWKYILYSKSNRVVTADAVEGLERFAAFDRYTAQLSNIERTYLTLMQEPEKEFAYDGYDWFMDMFHGAGIGSGGCLICGDDNLKDLAEMLRDEEWTKQLESLEILGFVEPEKYLDISSQEYKQQKRELCDYASKHYGFDEVELVVAKVNMADYKLYFAMEVGLMDGKWYNYATFDQIAGSLQDSGGFRFR